jgi:hypothetical protein
MNLSIYISQTARSKFDTFNEASGTYDLTYEQANLQLSKAYALESQQVSTFQIISSQISPGSFGSLAFASESIQYGKSRLNNKRRYMVYRISNDAVVLGSTKVLNLCQDV